MESTAVMVGLYKQFGQSVPKTIQDYVDTGHEFGVIFSGSYSDAFTYRAWSGASMYTTID